MNAGVPLVWFVAIGAAAGLLLGYALGMALGIATGKQQLIKRIRTIVARQHLNLDIDQLLRGEEGRTLDGFGA